MKRLLIVLAALLFISFSLSALTGEIVYVEGSVDLKTASGFLDWGRYRDAR